MQELIGKKLEEAVNLLNEKSTEYEVVLTEGGKMDKSDTEIVVNAQKFGDKIILTTCRFLLNI